MSDEIYRLIAVAIAAVTELYAMDDSKLPIFAKFWDIVATICGKLANVLGWIAVEARANYFQVVGTP
jgi:hypothetical protein